jgi:tetratricopeptide (TPR) repeat protein
MQFFETESLGHFRFSATSDRALQKRLAASDLTDPWAKLAAAYALNGRNDEAAQYFSRALQQADGYEARKQIGALAASFDNLPVELLKRQPDELQWQLARARQCAERGQQLLAEKQPAQAELEKARAIFTRLLSPLSNWKVLTPVAMKAATGAKMELQKDGSIFVYQRPPDENDTYTLVFQTELKGITGLRLEALADSRLPHGGPGWAGDGNFVLNELTLQAASAKSPDKRRAIPLGNASADFSQVHSGGWDVRGAVDGNGRTGWAVHPQVNKDHTAVFEMAEKVGDGQAARLTVRLSHQYAPDFNLGRFRLSFTNDATTLQATRIRLDLNDSEVVDLYLALGKAYAEQGQAEDAVASFTDALSLAANRAGKTKIVAAAAALEGVLEKLAERAAGDGQFQAELARHFAERGNTPRADAARAKARACFEEELAKEPENSALAAELGGLLLIDNPARWTVLKPVEAKSKLGATLSILPDHSILAGGTNPPNDRYRVVVNLGTDIDLAAVRLEALTHTSLPGNGPGRYPGRDGGQFLGTFGQESWKVTAKSPNRKDPITVEFENAWTEAGGFPITSTGGWDIANAGQGRNWTAIWWLSKPVPLVAGTTLTFEMQFARTESLGHFRLSATSDRALQKRLAAAKLTDLWARLAAAYAVNGRNHEAAQYFSRALQQADGYEARKPILEFAAHFDEVIAALVQRQPDDQQLQLALARNLAERGEQRLLDKQPAQAQAELEKCREILTRLRKGPKWAALTPVEMITENGSKLELQKDGSVFVHQPANNDTYSLVFQTELKGIKGLRLEALADSRLPHGGPGWSADGNFVLNELSLQAVPTKSPDQPTSVGLRNAEADFCQVAYGVWDIRGAVAGNVSTGWAVWPEFNKDHTAVFETAEELGDGKTTRLTVRLNFQYATKHLLGRFRLSFTNDAAALQAARIRLDLKDSEVVDVSVALAKAHAQQGRINEAVILFAEALDGTLPQEKCATLRRMVRSLLAWACHFLELARQSPGAKRNGDIHALVYSARCRTKIAVVVQGSCGALPSSGSCFENAG